MKQMVVMLQFESARGVCEAKSLCREIIHMKIEMGESLLYSWLRHVKECQIVQTNWKASNKWDKFHEEEIERVVELFRDLFASKYGYNVFKKNVSVAQIIQQTECDVMGVNLSGQTPMYYAAEVAFHEGGLNYGTREETVMKVIAKSIRIAMCLYGYMNCTRAQIVFASPKIMPSIMGDLAPCIEDINEMFKQQGCEFNVRLIANEEFNEKILQQILVVSDGVADTTELFIRGYQMYKMFDGTTTVPRRNRQSLEKDEQKQVPVSSYGELKIGQLARCVLRPMLEKGVADELEIKWLQEAEYCKKNFDLQYPLLIKTDAIQKEPRYYSEPLYIRGERYRMCSEWFEVAGNNDRPLLEKWISMHEKQ